MEKLRLQRTGTLLARGTIGVCTQVRLVLKLVLWVPHGPFSAPSGCTSQGGLVGCRAGGGEVAAIKSVGVPSGTHHLCGPRALRLFAGQGSLSSDVK